VSDSALFTRINAAGPLAFPFHKALKAMPIKTIDIQSYRWYIHGVETGFEQPSFSPAHLSPLGGLQCQS
jgi:hypothetical protein